MALSVGINSGFSLMKPKKSYFSDAMKFQLVSIPLTWCHKVGIVAGYSNSEMVNPILTQDILGGFLMNRVEKSHRRLSADLPSAKKGHSRRHRKI